MKINTPSVSALNWDNNYFDLFRIELWATNKKIRREYSVDQMYNIDGVLLVGFGVCVGWGGGPAPPVWLRFQPYTDTLRDHGPFHVTMT